MMTKTIENQAQKAQFLKEAERTHAGKYDYSKVVYKGQASKVEVLCPLHGTFYISPWRHVTKEAGCPVCAGYLNQEEIKVYNWLLNKLGMDKSIYTNNRPEWLVSDNGRKLELDFLIPDYNLAIEFNSSAFHYTSDIEDDYQAKSETYHKYKYEVCADNGINLIHIFDFENMDDWLRKLTMYLDRPEDHAIGFINCRRVIDGKAFYGRSIIERKIS